MSFILIFTEYKVRRHSRKRGTMVKEVCDMNDSKGVRKLRKRGHIATDLRFIASTQESVSRNASQAV